jgi:hypothetical protein
VFDIRRTCREVYDNARRALYCEAATIALPEKNEILDRHGCGECENPKCKVSSAVGLIIGNGNREKIHPPDRQI